MFIKNWAGDIEQFIVTNQPDDYRKNAKWPYVVTFPIGVGYSEADQLRRAYEYCTYMNKTITDQPPIS